MIFKKRPKNKISPEDLQEIAESYEKWGKKKKIIIISAIALVVMSVLTVVAFNVFKPVGYESAEIARSRELSTKMSLVMRNERVVENIVGSYRSRKDKYPTEIKLLTMDGKIKLPLGITLLDSSKDKLTADNGKTMIWYQYSNGASEGSGARIQYWDYGSDSIGLRSVYLGDATKDSEFFDMK
jgi:hypothetical protein